MLNIRIVRPAGTEPGESLYQQQFPNGEQLGKLMTFLMKNGPADGTATLDVTLSSKINQSTFKISDDPKTVRDLVLVANGVQLRGPVTKKEAE